MLELPRIEGGFRCIAADPATKFVAGTKGRPQHYPRMTDHELAAMPVRDVVADDAWLFLWVTGPKLYRPKRSKTLLRPEEIAEAWGFRYSGIAFTWVKLHARFGKAGMPLFWNHGHIHKGMGYTTRKTTELVLLFRRGMPQRTSKSVEEVIIAPLREHSRKPDDFYTRVESYCPGPRLELFARESRPNWSTWGNEATKFDMEAAE